MIGWETNPLGSLPITWLCCLPKMVWTQPRDYYWEWNLQKNLWDFNIQTDHGIEARRPDMVVIDKILNKGTIIDFVVPFDFRAAAE